MRRQRGLVGLMGLAAVAGIGMLAQPAAARVTTEQSASILVFPKVIADGTRDTIIQITNTSNNMRHAHCFYTNGAPTVQGLPVGPLNPPLWTEIDFDIWLTKQQPTHWVVSTGRRDDASDSSCRGAATNASLNCDPADSGAGNGDADCCDAGFDPGRVPPVVPDFTGELKCIEVDGSGFPVAGNAFKGEATLEDLATGDVSKYNAIGLKGFDTNNMDGTLCLGGGVSSACPTGAEYEACPQSWILNHSAVGAADQAINNGAACTDPEGDCSVVTTNLTVVPCTQNYETQSPAPVTLQFAITNEFEQTFSASTSVTCWASYNLGEETDANNPFGGINPIFRTENIGGAVLQTRVRSAALTQFGIAAVIEETRVQCPAGNTDCVGGAVTAVTRSAQNGHTSFADQAGQDRITIPSEQIQVP